MRFRIVIVEDNPLTVRSLVETIDWAKLDCEVVRTAQDGETGRQVILETKPDILLMDIRMPQCGGMEMLESVRQAIPDCKVIIITGYDEFEYASKAIKLAVSDYLLKPIKNDEVIRSVCKAAEELRCARSAQESVEMAARFRRQAQLLSLLTNPSQKGQGIHQVFRELGLSFAAYYIMTVQLTDGAAFSEAAISRMDGIFAERKAEVISCLLYDTYVAFVMEREESGTWREEASALAGGVSGEINEQVNIGVSARQRSLHAIRQAYQQARQAMWLKALDPAGQAACFYEPESERALPSPQVVRFNQRLAELIEKADLTDDSARAAARAMAALSGHQYGQLRAMVAMYTLEMRKKYGASSSPETDAALYECWFVTGPGEAEECLLKLCAALRAASAEPGYSLLIQNTLQYINLHAVEGLQLSEVAERMCVSSNYLSALIRKETGVTFHEHVLRARMAVARTMLADPRILVEEVARAVGYSNYISFYNAFKRAENMTPTYYRNRKVKV